MVGSVSWNDEEVSEFDMGKKKFKMECMGEDEENPDRVETKRESKKRLRKSL